MLIQEVLLLSAVRERNIVERNDRRWEAVDVLEVELQWARRLDFLDETSCLHLVDDLLLGLGLLDEIGVRSGGSDESEKGISVRDVMED